VSQISLTILELEFLVALGAKELVHPEYGKRLGKLH
jgi:hypothetical protein